VEGAAGTGERSTGRGDVDNDAT